MGPGDKPGHPDSAEHQNPGPTGQTLVRNEKQITGMISMLDDSPVKKGTL